MTEDRDDLREFAQTVSPVDGKIDLTRAALLIASPEYADLDTETEIAALDSMANVVGRRIAAGEEPVTAVNILSEYLFDELGFEGARNNYHDPRNSFLNEVLTRRVGIPIMLSLLYIEVGRRVGIPLVGLGMPYHFMVKHPEVDDLLIDRFRRGILLSIDECAERLRERSDGSVKWDDRFLIPVTGREFVARILRNLKAIYLHKSDFERALNTLDRLLIVRPTSVHDMRDRGLVHYRLGNFPEALHDLDGYIASGVAGSDIPNIQEVMKTIKRSLGTQA